MNRHLVDYACLSLNKLEKNKAMSKEQLKYTLQLQSPTYQYLTDCTKTIAIACIYVNRMIAQLNPHVHYIMRCMHAVCKHTITPKKVLCTSSSTWSSALHGRQKATILYPRY